MAFIGNSPQNQSFAPAIDYFNGNGVTVTFTLSRPVVSVAQMIVAIDNVIQNPSSSFTVAGNAITFSSAPLSGTNNIWVEYTSLITTYQGISQDPTVIGDIRATGGYLAEGDFGNSYVDGTIVDYVTGNARITTGPIDDMTLYHGGTASRSEMMKLSYAGNSYIVGNLGVGLTSPTCAVDAYSTTSNAARVRVTGTTNYAMLQAVNSGGNLYCALDNSTGSAFGVGNYSAVLWNGANSPLVFATNNTEKMRISSAGNVGIGTDNPQAKLDVRSQINVAQASPYSASIQAVKASGFGYDQNAYRAVIFGPTSGNQSVAIGFDPSTIAGGSFNGGGMEVVWKRQSTFICPNAGATDWQTVLYWTGTAVTIPGSLSKGSGSFRIDHPLPALEETHQLVHSFIEGPQADLIYRGVATLVAGKATINIDTASGMTEGTFEVLCREVQCFTTNESDWVAVRGKVVGNILTIEAQDATATSTISWMVIGERKDKHMLETEWTDENGKVIVEPLKPVEEKATK
jgi:hypothetical protein